MNQVKWRRCGCGSIGTAAALVLSSACLWGAAFGQTGVQINLDSNGNNIRGDAANEPSLAVDPHDPLHFVVGWRQFPSINSDARYAGYAVSTDGGRTWFNGGTLAPPPGDPNAQQSDPVVAPDADGRFYYNSLLFRGQHPGIYTYGSDDGGFSWNEPVLTLGGFADKNWFEIDRSGAGRNHYCIWGNSTIYIKRSVDEGQTWQAEQSLGRGISSYVAIGLQGEVYTAWWNLSQTPRIGFRRSLNGYDPNQTPAWDPEVQLRWGDWPWQLPVNPAGGAGQVYIAVDPSDGPRRGNLYVLSSVVPGDTNDVCDVYFARSTDGGQTFSNPVRVNDDPVGPNYQWMATMSIAPGGRLDAAWFDTRDDANHFLSRLYYSYSYDGGQTWAPNRAVGDQFDPSLGYPQQNKIGDYFQSQSDNGAMNVVHSATYNGEQDLYFRRLYPMVLDVSALRGGDPGTFDVSGGKANERTWIAYSTRGEGYTYVNPLGVGVYLNRPQVGVGPTNTDAFGDVSWTVTMPNAASGHRLWFQAVQDENSSNVVVVDVQ